MSIPERPAQLLLLQDSLIKLKDYEVCFTIVLLHIPFLSWPVV